MVYLIPSFLSENAVESIPPYVLQAVKKCEVIFAENIRTARRFLKQLDKEIVIDNFTWFEIRKDEKQLIGDFRKCVCDGREIGIISEAGCPGVADPGQVLVAIAQEMGAVVKPMVGPSSILLALMASGMNGQQFAFHGYLPIETSKRNKKLKELEDESFRKNQTQIFIETPYRNTSLFQDILKVCKSFTLFCIAADITSADEWIKTMPVGEWKKSAPDLPKRPVIFLLYAGRER